MQIQRTCLWLRQLIFGITTLISGAAVVLAGVRPIAACTVMQMTVNGRLVVARNHDWISGGGLIIVNPCGIAKQAISPVKPLSWTSRYGSVSMNQFGREIPFAGMNEKGLTVDLLQLKETQFPDATDPRPSVNSIQWVQYQLDCSANVAEVIATLAKVRPQPFIPQLERVHYFVTDPSGDAAVIEFLNGEAVVQHEPKTACVLANSTWEHSTRVMSENNATTSSETRVTLARRLTQDVNRLPVTLSPIRYALDSLDRVQQPATTQWGLVYEPTERRITMRTRLNRSVRWIDLDDLELHEDAPVLCVDINSPDVGDLAARLTPLTREANQRIVNEAFDAIVPPSFVRSAVKQLVIQYGESLESLPRTAP